MQDSESEKPVYFVHETDVLGQNKPGAISPIKSRKEELNEIFLEIEFPNLVTRVQTLIIDAVLILIFIILASSLINLFSEVPIWVRIVLFIATFYIYEPFLISYRCTMGQYMTGIRVRRFSNPNKKISLGSAYLRFFFKGVFGWLSFITISFNKYKRAIHDFTGNSVVIMKKKN